MAFWWLHLDFYVFEKNLLPVFIYVLTKNKKKKSVICNGCFKNKGGFIITENNTIFFFTFILDLRWEKQILFLRIFPCYFQVFFFFINHLIAWLVFYRIRLHHVTSKCALRLKEVRYLLPVLQFLFSHGFFADVFIFSS